MSTQTIAHKKKDIFDSIVDSRIIDRNRNSYYYNLVSKHVKFLIPEGSSVLEIGCFGGKLLNSLKPKKALGIDFSTKVTEYAQEKYKDITFKTCDIDNINIDDTFDYVVINNVIGYAADIQKAFRQIKKACNPDTKIILIYHSQVWRPILRIAEFLRLRTKWPEQHWLSTKDLENILYLEDIRVIRRSQQVLIPFYIPLISTIFNRFIVHLPLIRNFTLNHVFIAQKSDVNHDDLSCSVIIPCRNEKGNIEAAITRTPLMGTFTEFIFVEGGSQDGTLEECYRIQEKYKDRNIKVLQQKGKGKGDAVREGYAAATGDIFMILDSDLTVPPEDLSEFFDAIVSGKGEFINGSRLVYEMEDEAMRFLNMLANKSFSIILTHLLGQYLKDTLCGTKVLTRENYEKIAAGRSYFGDFDPFGDFDLLFGAAKLNLKIVEIPVHYKARTYGSTQISRFTHGWLLIKMTLFAAKKIKYV